MEAETNGIRASHADLLGGMAQVASPNASTFGAGKPESRIGAAALRAFVSSGKTVFKFGVTSPSDLDEVAVIEQRFELAPLPAPLLRPGRASYELNRGVWVIRASASSSTNVTGRTLLSEGRMLA